MRDELGLLVDFMAEIMKKEGHKLIGIRGMPRVGKQNPLLLQVFVQIKGGYLYHLLLLSKLFVVN